MYEIAVKLAAENYIMAVADKERMYLCMAV